MIDRTDWPYAVSRVRSETFIRHVERHDEIGSTNDRALVLAADRDLPTPALVLTARQTAGRGRSANVWRSGEGSLTFSVAIERPRSFPAERTPILSLVTGLAVREAIATFAPSADAKVKWPNDVYLAGRKACGILAEVPSTFPSRIVIGIGINANNDLAGAPDDVRSKAISLREATGAQVELGDLLVATLVALEEQLASIAEAGELSMARWSRHCLLSGRTVRLRTPREEITGRCLGVAASGELILETVEGVRKLAAGEVIAFSS